MQRELQCRNNNNLQSNYSTDRSFFYHSFCSLRLRNCCFTLKNSADRLSFCYFVFEVLVTGMAQLSSKCIWQWLCSTLPMSISFTGAFVVEIVQILFIYSFLLFYFILYIYLLFIYFLQQQKAAPRHKKRVEKKTRYKVLEFVQRKMVIIT